MNNSKTNTNDKSNTNQEKDPTKNKVTKDVTNRDLKAALIANSIKIQPDFSKSNLNTK